MENYLYTGTWLLHNQNDKRMLGGVSAFGPTDKPGRIRLTLKGQEIPWKPHHINLQESNVQWQLDGEDLIIELPEESACKLAEQLVSVAARLEQLRGLLRRGHLTAEAIYSDEEIPGTPETY